MRPPPGTPRRRGWSTRHRSSKARLRGAFWAGLDLIPNIVIGLMLLLGAVATSHHELTLGGLVAFITLTLLLVWPIEAMGYILASGQEAATAAQRVYEIMDTEPAITGPPGPAHAPVPAVPSIPRPGRGRRQAPGRLIFDRRRVPLPGLGAACPARVAWNSSRARPWPSPAGPGPARRPCSN